MKKSLFMLGLAVAAMTSCTNDEVVDVKQPTQHAIGFESFVNKGTRAADGEETVTVTNEVTASNLNRFYVYGYHDGSNPTVFNDVLVVKDGSNWKMAEANEKDWETQKYAFAAIADGAGTGVTLTGTAETKVYTSSFADETLKITSYTVDVDQTKQTDLIAALAGRDNTSSFVTTKVDLSFQHLLSKVSFTFENTNTSNLSMEISEVKLTVKNSADCAYSSTSTSWTNHASQATEYTLTAPTGKIEKGATSEVSAEYFVIPGQTDATISFKVTYYDANSQSVEEYTKELSLFTDSSNQSVAWNPSYIYEYNVQLPASPKKIEFNVTNVGTWKQETVTLDGSNS